MGPLASTPELEVQAREQGVQSSTRVWIVSRVLTRRAGAFACAAPRSAHPKGHQGMCRPCAKKERPLLHGITATAAIFENSCRPHFGVTSSTLPGSS